MPSLDQHPRSHNQDLFSSLSKDSVYGLTESDFALIGILRPIAVAEVGLMSEQAQHPQQNSGRISLEDEQLLCGNDDGLNPEQQPLLPAHDLPVTKTARRVMWQETGYTPPLKGGQDMKREKENSVQMNWELFDIDPQLARRQLTAIYRAEHPEWDEVTVARRVASGELLKKIERHDQLRDQFGASDERVAVLFEDIKFWRLVLRGF